MDALILKIENGLQTTFEVMNTTIYMEIFLLGITEKYRKQDMSSFVISSQCNNCMAYQAKYKRKTATAK